MNIDSRLCLVIIDIYRLCLVVDVVPGPVVEAIRVEGGEEVELAPVQQPGDLLVVAVLLTERPHQSQSQGDHYSQTLPG